MDAFGVVIASLQLVVLAVVSVIVLLSRTDVCILHRWGHSARRSPLQSVLALSVLLAVCAAVWSMAHGLLSAIEPIQGVRQHVAAVLAALIGYPLYRSIESAPWLGLTVDVQAERLGLQEQALLALWRGEGLARVIAEVDSRIATLEAEASPGTRSTERAAMLWQTRRVLEQLGS